jgi:hypothetical protein
MSYAECEAIPGFITLKTLVYKSGDFRLVLYFFPGTTRNFFGSTSHN